MFIPVKESRAEVLIVNDCGDDGKPEQLRSIINTAGAGDAIDVSKCTQITLKGAADDDMNTSGDLDIRAGGDLTIQGAAGLTKIDGGGVDRIFDIFSNTNVVLKNLIIQGGNPGNGYGGGIQCRLQSIVELIGTTVTGNTTQSSGGGIYCGGTLTLRNSVVISNFAGSGGGGIHVPSGGTINAEDTIISQNSTAYHGGAIFIVSTVGPTVLDLKKTTISKNIADSDNDQNGDGGGIYSYEGPNTNYVTITFSDGTISENSAVQGGGVSQMRGKLTMSNSTVSANLSKTDGGGLYLFDVNPSLLTGVTISNNTADSGNSGGFKFGGGMYIAGFSGNGDTTIGNSSVVNNTAPYGGGISSNKGKLLLVNTLLGGNTALKISGGLGITSGSAKLSHVTIAQNKSLAGSGAGIFANENTTSTKNTLISGNTDSSGVGKDCFGTLDSLDYNLIKDITNCIIQGVVANNIYNQEPRLDANFIPLLGSPIIDAIAAGASCETKDLRSVARPVDGDGNGVALCDIGAFEFNASIIQFESSSYSIGEQGGKISVTVTRSGGTDGAIAVTYSTSDVTAIAGQDYTVVSGQLNWADKDTTAKTFEVPILQDNDTDPNEVFQIVLSQLGGNATLGAKDKTDVHISDDDSAGEISFSAASYSFTEGSGKATITVVRGGSAGAASVNYKTDSGGTATDGQDYTAVSVTLSWNAGDGNAKTFEVPILTDNQFEGDETINLTLEGAQGSTLGALNKAVLTIVEDDLPSVLQFSTGVFSVMENAGSVDMTVKRSGVSGAISVDYATVARLSPVDGYDPATAGEDYQDMAGTLHWGDGDGTDKTFTVQILDDSLVEKDELIWLELKNPQGGAQLGAVSGATIFILEDDSAGVIQLNSDNYAVSESDGIATISVSRVSGATGAVSVKYSTVSGGTATDGQDYTATSGILNWADGDREDKTFTVAIKQDDVVEGDETVKIALSGAEGVGISLGQVIQATLTIRDSTAAPPPAPTPQPTPTPGPTPEPTPTPAPTPEPSPGDGGATQPQGAGTEPAKGGGCSLILSR